MSRYRQTMREALEQVRQQFTEGHSDKDFKPYPDWKKTAGGMYPRFKHTQKGEIQVDRYGEWLHSDKSGKTVAFYRNHFPKTNTTGGTSMKLTDYLKKINEEVINEVSDHEISMARGELEAIADKATQLAGALQGKSDEGNPLEAWVQSKITKAKDYINSVSDYLTYDPSMKQNEETLEEKFALYALRDFTDTRAHGGMRKKGDRASGPMTYTQAISKAKQMNAGSSIGGSKDVEVRPFKEETEVNEKTYGWTLVSKAKDLAKKFKDNMTKAVEEIEKLEKGLSKNPTVDAELRKYNEQLEEKYTVVITKKDGSTMELGRYNTPAEAQRYVDQYGKGAKVKKEEVKLDEIDEKISDIFKANKEGESIDDIAKRLKLSTSMVKKLIGEAKDEEEKKEEPKKEDSKENKESEIQSLKDQIAMLKQKLENEKNKAIKPEPNPETGEVPLTIGVAHAEFKKKKEEVKAENLQELSKAERDKRIQRAKDMIKYYDAQKKAALKGPNKALAKKMLKNETELEEVSQKEIDKFHTDLDNLVHKTFGHSSDEKKKEKMDEKVASSIIKDLQKAYAPMKGKRISPEMANKISKHLDQKSYDLDVLRQLKKADIPFISTIARNKIYKKTGKFEQSNNPKDMDKHFKTLSIKAQTKVNELLRQGMGYWDAVAKAKRMYNEDRRLYVEGIAGLQKKADKSGMPYSILKKVYDRGMAAWKSGHRPGASQQQWAFARVNSFITKSSGTWGGADKDLAAKVKGSK